MKTGEEGKWDEEEIITSSSPTNVQLFLKTLGFEFELVIVKHREMWTYESFSICFDDVKGLGQFIEIEGPSWNFISSFAKSIGIIEKPIKKGYVKMFEELGKK